MQQHAERPAHIAEDLLDGVHDVVMAGATDDLSAIALIRGMATPFELRAYACASALEGKLH